ncbi:ATP-binding protein [Alkalilimnicola ehrlichii MLHE-1]|uniref:AAA+ ATPase domain-containing protein n=1 Tax=Alkalilimnicola ehrlichii (strain ATCC BAA-1101 / DSM 17681 / MLHE-1) TaxID=187272 RepID=Q0ABZ1_ALKEH|nr:ATP-binding protein [Alkalilimnicola ehrlichii]ABI55646.1 protein of unknown function DUF815 [Alkalilimnicola ehrlichii MLHE-1]
MDRLKQFLDRAEQLLDRLEPLLPAQPDIPWDQVSALRWSREGHRAGLVPVRHPHRIAPEALKGIDRQRTALDRNTRQFLRQLPANNALLWGSRGTGKSSLVKALLTRYADQGLRLVELDRYHLPDLPLLLEQLADRPERFILFCDDLSFEADDPGYKALKAALDGSISVAPENVLIYATSNRRHLLPEYHSENEQTRLVDGEIHHGEAVEEKISLSERFGLWLSFYPFDQEAYLEIVFSWLKRLGATADDPEQIRAEALRYALGRGSRSGRVAWQFARDYAGRRGLADPV